VAAISGVPGLLSQLLQQIVQGEKAASPSGEAARPQLLVAKVLGRRDNLVLLRWLDQEILARLDASAAPGETLLLQLKEVKDGRYYYKILSRFRGDQPPESAGSGEEEPVQYGIFNPGPAYGDYPPVLVRFRSAGGGRAAAGKQVLLELFVETANLGLILIRAGRGERGLFCHLLVENRETGELLDREARRLVREHGGDDPGPGALSWQVADLRELAASFVKRGGLSLDRKA